MLWRKFVIYADEVEIRLRKIRIVCGSAYEFFKDFKKIEISDGKNKIVFVRER